MKTIMDAVSELKGSLENIEQNNCPAEFVVVNVRTGIYYRSWVCEEPIPNFDDYRKVCTTIEFGRLVNELSHATWIKGTSLAEYQAADKEVLKVEGKTVEVDGMVVEIGKLYLFSDKNGDSEIGELSLAGDVNDGNGLMYQSKVSLRNSNKYEWWHSISAIKSDIGTITPAPVKLVGDAAYAFEYQDEDMLGRYHIGTNRFIVGNSNVKAEKVKNITRLVPEVK